MDGLRKTRGQLVEESASARRRIKDLEEVVSPGNKARGSIQGTMELYRLHFSLANDVMFSYDNRFVLRSISPNVERLLGYRPEELLGRSFQELGVVDPEDMAEAFDNALQVLSGKPVNGSIYRFIAKDGTRKFGEVSGVPLWHDGHVSGVISVARDITRRVELEHAFREEAERYLIHFSLASDILYSVDTRTRLTNISPNVERVIGYKPSEIIGRPFQELRILHPDDVDRAVSDALSIISGKTIPPSVYRFITRDGTVKYGETRAVPLIRNGRLVEIIAVARDITHWKQIEEEIREYHDHLEELIRERTIELERSNEQLKVEVGERLQAQEELRESEAKYRFLTEKMNDIVWTADLDFNVTYDSPAVQKVMGFTREERMKQKASEMVTPESYARILEVLGKELERDGMQGVDPDRKVMLELEYYHRGGSTVWMECLVSAIRDHEGKIVGIHGVSRDITERRRAEDELRRQRENLEGAVRERTAELTLANEHLLQEIELRKETESALRVLLRQREEDRMTIEKDIMSNISSFVLPHVVDLESSCLNEKQKSCLTMVKSYLEQIISPFARKVSTEYHGLSPNEIKVASMIKEGMQSKDIARLLGVSLNTVHSYRYSIRMKTGLKNNKVNLRTYLQGLG
ncbi:MAG TPA: PAS domain S-box protein [Deltaproteobacteria bacterium]|nr:PAS domain S-box protein [Deltaproteobacteria bacterium]HPJ92630.1 PAS domain S-box protein [Deltaproteobacteria bacterium]HPR55233.1 PAS domain S-box protein [Deltaproteobacteria bacterium]